MRHLTKCFATAAMLAIFTFRLMPVTLKKGRKSIENACRAT